MSEDIVEKQAVSDIFMLFFDSIPATYQIIDTSRSDTDFREVIIAELENGEKAVVKLSDNDFTDPHRIVVWQRTVEEYRRLGYYCPRIFADKTGSFPTVRYKERNCVAYAEEYSAYRLADERHNITASDDTSTPDKYVDDAWIMTARIASEYLSYADFPSGYCLFEKFCPSDKNDEVLDVALDWKNYAETLPVEFQPQIERIWKLWCDNRAALEPLYRKLPTTVLQADLNSTNLLVDDDGNFVGVCDFNLCGREVFLNYLMRETRHSAFSAELNEILCRLKLVSGYYHFSDIEKQAALMLYRCLKPLWWDSVYMLKKLGGDTVAQKRFLDEIEELFTRDIDFSTYMTA